jgi:4-aminobutyrate aminotransferase/(S)-3-amino-2-methylpropionate transaminase
MTTAKADAYATVAAREHYVPRGLGNTHAIFVARAEGTRVWDVDGKEYLDFTSGIGVLNTGHRHPRVVRAVHEQVDRLMHTCFQVAMYEPYVELAARLCGLAGGDAPQKAILFTTGAEAIENAVKIARAYTKRPAVVAFSGGFHGRTLLALTMTASSPAYRQNFGPFAPDIYHAPFPDEYHGWTAEAAIDALEHLFSTQLTPDQVAAVVIEPELGEGGFVPAPAAFMQRLRALTVRHGIVFIADEVQSGFGRTGKMFGYQHAGIEPDLIAIAKSLASGLPLSAVVGKAAIMDAPLRVASAAPTAATRSLARRRSRCSTSSRRRGWSRGERRSAIRSAARCCACRRACRRSATCAAWVRCWRSRWSRIRRARLRTRNWRSGSSTRRAIGGCCC